MRHAIKYLNAIRSRNKIPGVKVRGHKLDRSMLVVVTRCSTENEGCKNCPDEQMCQKLYSMYCSNDPKGVMEDLEAIK